MHISQLKRLRWAVRGTLVLGVAASVAANVLHADPNPISQTIAAWPSLAFLLVVELCSRIPVGRWQLAAIRIAAQVAVSGIAAWVSYWHMVDVAVRYGEDGSSPYLLPVSVDGLVVVASISLIELGAMIRARMDAVQPVVVKVPTAPAAAPVSPGMAPVVVPADVPVAATRGRSPRGGRSGPQVSPDASSRSGLGEGPLLRTPPQSR